MSDDAAAGAGGTGILFVDYGNVRGACAIGLGEIAAGHQAGARGCEIAGADDHRHASRLFAGIQNERVPVRRRRDQRQVVGRSGGFHAGHGPQAVERLLIVLPGLGIWLLAGAIETDRQSSNVAGAQSQVRTGQFQEGAAHAQRAGYQDDGQGRLQGEERAAHADRAGRGARVRSQRSADEHSGKHAEHQAAEHGERARKNEHPPIEDGVPLGRKKRRRLHRGGQAAGPVRHNHASRGGGQGEGDALRDQLLHQAGAAGAEGGANRQFRCAFGDAGEQKLRHAGAGDQQHEGPHRQQHQRGLARGTRQLLLEGDQAGAIGGIFSKRPGVLPLEFGLVHGGRAGQVGAGRQASERADALVRVGGPQPIAIEVSGRPDGGLAGIVETGRRHADDSQRRSADPYGGAENAGIAAEKLLPCAVADHGDHVRAGHVLIRGEPPAGLHFGPERGEKAGAGLGDVHADGLSAAHEVHLRGVVRRGVLPVSRLAAPAVKFGALGDFDGEAIEVRQLHQAVRFAERQSAQKQRIHHAEHAGGGAYGERQRSQRQRGGQGSPPVGAGGVAQVLDQLVQQFPWDGNRQVPEGVKPKGRPGRPACGVAVIVRELTLQRRFELLAEARRVESQEQPVEPSWIGHGAPHASSGIPRLPSASRTSFCRRTASACATLLPSAVMR